MYDQGNSMKVVWIIIGILILSMFFILILYVLSAWPFNQQYKYIDPQTGKPVDSNQDWLDYPDMTYGPWSISLAMDDIRPSYNLISDAYCKYNPNSALCIDYPSIVSQRSQHALYR